VLKNISGKFVLQIISSPARSIDVPGSADTIGEGSSIVSCVGNGALVEVVAVEVVVLGRTVTKYAAIPATTIITITITATLTLPTANLFLLATYQHTAIRLLLESDLRVFLM
jgi:hypothetical protein